MMLIISMFKNRLFLHMIFQIQSMIVMGMKNTHVEGISLLIIVQLFLMKLRKLKRYGKRNSKFKNKLVFLCLLYFITSAGADLYSCQPKVKYLILKIFR